MQNILETITRLFYCPFTVIFMWICCLIQMVAGFTFAHANGYIPIFLTVFTVLMVLVWKTAFRHSGIWRKVASYAIWAFATLPPLVPWSILIGMSYRGARLIGRWPMPSDNPKAMAAHDTVFQHLWQNYDYALGYAGWGLITFWLLLIGLWRHITRKHRGWMLVAFIASWLFIVCEPTQRIWWELY